MQETRSKPIGGCAAAAPKDSEEGGQKASSEEDYDGRKKIQNTD